MKQILTFCFITLLIALPGAASLASSDRAEPPAFFSDLQDIPLAPGAIEHTEKTTAYDKADGRLISVLAAINSTTEEQITRFYAENLPQFGWKQDSPTLFLRDQEQLELSFESENTQNFLRITISPAH